MVDATDPEEDSVFGVLPREPRSSRDRQRRLFNLGWFFHFRGSWFWYDYLLLVRRVRRRCGVVGDDDCCIRGKVGCGGTKHVLPAFFVPISTNGPSVDVPIGSRWSAVPGPLPDLPGELGAYF